MKQLWILAVAGLLTSCASTNYPSATRAVGLVKRQFAPDHHTEVFDVAAQTTGKHTVLTGEVSRPEAKAAALATVSLAGFEVTDHIEVLPSAELGDATNGIASLSVASGREQPGHAAEMGTQILMGHTFTVLKQTNGWCLVQSADRYLSWVQKGAFVRCNAERVAEWNAAPRLIVTAFEDRVLEQPQAGAQPVSEVVPGCLLKKTGDAGEWFKVELPDQRAGYLPKSAAMDYAEWRRTRHPTAAAIEQTARTFLGRPYLWGGNSPKGMDCSGFTKLTYFLNGVDLNRNASQQVYQGTEVPLDAEYSQLKKGDLLFFGSRGGRGRGRATGTSGPTVTHVGIYLGDKLFIHSSEFVHINSLDMNSPLKDERRIRTLIYARRVLPGS